jgi:predicted DNA-binding protein YlxM (UPF0122 family)
MDDQGVLICESLLLDGMLLEEGGLGKIKQWAADKYKNAVKRLTEKGVPSKEITKAQNISKQAISKNKAALVSALKSKDEKKVQVVINQTKQDAKNKANEAWAKEQGSWSALIISFVMIVVGIGLIVARHSLTAAHSTSGFTF